MNVDERTQELIALQIGMLHLSNARLQAELEQAQAAARAAEGLSGAQGANASDPQRQERSDG